MELCYDVTLYSIPPHLKVHRLVDLQYVFPIRNRSKLS
jgi:hypothetical protein